MLLNPITENWIKAYINRPQAAALINANNDLDSGLKVLTQIHNGLTDSKNNPLLIVDIEPDKKSIGIEQIRELHSSLSLSANKDDLVSRVIGVLNADRITLDGQNALLKLLEELPDRTIIVLVANTVYGILATIKSRCFTINVLPITYKQACEFGNDNGYEESTIKSAYLLSDGSYHMFRSHLKKNDLKSNSALTTAKEFISKSVFERQEIVTKITTKDYDINEFLNYLIITAKTGMRNANTSQLKNRWKDILKEILKTQTQINANVPKKLAFLRLSVSLT